MGITSQQFETWSNRGAITTAQRTHEAIRGILESDSRLIGKIETFLQGSYRNATNIYGDSDVDIVVRLKDTFRSDVSLLTEEEKALREAAYSPATYLWDQFYLDVSSCLHKNYPGLVTEGNKSIIIDKGASGRLMADVVPALTHKRYYHFRSHSDHSCDEGIEFVGRKDGSKVANFPKQHIDNGESKNVATNNLFKPSVRIFKNWRNHLVSQGLLEEGIAPSYFIEGLIYNVPNEHFDSDYQRNAHSLLLWLYKNVSNNFTSQNGVHLLFGGDSTQWDIEKAKKFLTAALLST